MEKQRERHVQSYTTLTIKDGALTFLLVKNRFHIQTQETTFPLSEIETLQLANVFMIHYQDIATAAKAKQLDIGHMKKRFNYDI